MVLLNVSDLVEIQNTIKEGFIAFEEVFKIQKCLMQIYNTNVLAAEQRGLQLVLVPP